MTSRQKPKKSRKFIFQEYDATDGVEEATYTPVAESRLATQKIIPFDYEVFDMYTTNSFIYAALEAET